MKSPWPLLPFDSVFDDCSGGNAKTLQSDYKAAGRFAVVDQGKDLVAGYVDDPALLCNAALPAIVFGDHTRIFKFIDFPFCMGADGTKVLRPKLRADEKFLYYYLRSLDIAEAGYSRHFRILKRMQIALPPLEEQRRIAAILDKADALRQKRSAALQKLDSLTQSLFLDMFGDPRAKPNDKSALPLSTLVRVGDGINYGVVQPGGDFEGGIPLVRVGDFTAGRFDRSLQKTIDPLIESSYVRSRLRGDELLVSCVGSIGTTALCMPEMRGMNIARAVARVPADPDKVDRLYLLSYMRTDFVQDYFRSQVRTVNQPTLNIKELGETPVYLASKDAQKQFARIAAQIFELRPGLNLLNAKVEQLWNSLQQTAFRGEL